MRSRVYVSIGSNVEREFHIVGAIAALRARYAPLTCSRVYETAAAGFSGADFFNLVVGFDTEEPITTVLAHLREIEHAHGRRRGDAKFGPRTLDLDLLLYGDCTTTVDTVTLPRPDILEYDFVLGPLAEIAALEQHPTLHVSYGELWCRRRAEGACLVPAAGFVLPTD
jgi:2-amino-4-hydroxy-6-hydroxymethyldihydropteridine diphosphokinase